MVVEDDEDNLVAICDLLDAAGYEPLTARSVSEALALLRDFEPPCIVLLDLKLPDGSGGIVMTYMETDDFLRRVPILVVTAMPLVEDRFRGREVLRKPFAIDTLYSMVHRLVGAAGIEPAAVPV